MKTYSRLQNGRRILSEYEVVSSDLHPNYPSRFELGPGSPVARWYAQHREGSPLQVRTWETFSDPAQTTYQVYTSRQDRQEQVLDTLFDEIDETGYDDGLTTGWLSWLHDHYAPLRYPFHGMQMLAAYVAQMAPSSKITNCAAFQAGNELRCGQRLAYRTAQLLAHRPGPDPAEHRASWERAACFQPLRELVERALVTYDWAESLVLLDLVVEPILDRWLNHELAVTLGGLNGDSILRSIHFSLAQDSRWHRDWSSALLHLAIDDDAGNRELVQQWLLRWRPLAHAALEALASTGADAPVPIDGAAGAGMREWLATNVWGALGLEVPG